MIQPFVLYGLLALAALVVMRHDSELRWIGAWLVIGWAVSNLIAWYAPVTFRPGPYTMIEMMVALAAYLSWGEHRYRALLLIVVVNAASICANFAFAYNFPPSPQQIWLFEATTNTTFALECALAIGVGVAHGRRAGHFVRWPRLRWRAAQPDVARKARP